jgi:hypothetical protein
VFVNIIKQMLVLFEIIFNKFILMCLNLNWIIKRDQTTRPGWVLLDPLKKTIHADLQGHVHAPDLFFFSSINTSHSSLFSKKKKSNDASFDCPVLDCQRGGWKLGLGFFDLKNYFQPISI